MITRNDLIALDLADLSGVGKLERAWEIITGFFQDNISWEPNPALRKKFSEDSKEPSLAPIVRAFSDKGLSTKDVAKGIDMPYQTLYKKLRGENPITRETVRRISDVTGIRYTKIIELIEEGSRKTCDVK